VGGGGPGAARVRAAAAARDQGEQQEAHEEACGREPAIDHGTGIVVRAGTRLVYRSAVGATLWDVVESPVGDLILSGDGEHLTGLAFRNGALPPGSPTPEPFAEVREQLAAYFDGERKEFDVPLRLEGPPFSQAVWTKLREVGFGETVSYGWLAGCVGAPKAVRAVGAANGRNPVAIIVPCHRVVGSDGKLTGYGGGLERKAWLLDFEAARR
jgi:methylated-DNA-[protein]-cysteine S-methyltransferase